MSGRRLRTDGPGSGVSYVGVSWVCGVSHAFLVEHCARKWMCVCGNALNPELELHELTHNFFSLPLLLLLLSLLFIFIIIIITIVVVIVVLSPLFRVF